jgi:PII-like signaling protein
MDITEQCLRLRVYAGESDRWERRPLYEAIVLKARKEGLAGATVFRSPLGFGATSRIHTAKILNLSTDLPIVVEIVDTAPKVEAFLAKLGEMIQGGMVTVEPVKVIHYRHEKKES